MTTRKFKDDAAEFRRRIAKLADDLEELTHGNGRKTEGRIWEAVDALDKAEACLCEAMKECSGREFTP